MSVTTPTLSLDVAPRFIRLLRLPEVCKATGLGRAMIYRLQADHRFPKSVKITEHAVGWIESEVQTWLAERAAARHTAQSTA